MDEHLQSCTEHAAAAAELGRTQSLLALTVDEGQPSPELRRRIMQAIDADPIGDQSPTTPGLDATRARRIRRMPRLTLRPIHGAIAAALMLSLGLGGVIGYLLRQAGQPVSYSFVGAPSSAPGAPARLVYFKDPQQAGLAVDVLPRLAARRGHQIWVIHGRGPGAR